MHKPFATTRRSLVGNAIVLASVSAAAGTVASCFSPEAYAKDATSMTTPNASPAATPIAKPDLPLAEIGILTGSDSAAFNQTGKEYGVDGTDLGSSFLYKDQLYLVFGDTFGIGKSDWRSNVLAISSDDDPSDGIIFDRMIVDRPGHAKELLSAKHIEGQEVTVIPTYGVAVGDRLFLHYMSVSHWGEPGHWDLSHAGWAYSDDAGETWTKDPDAVFPADTNWGQVAIEEHEGYLYLFGIPGGRYGDLKLARVVPGDLLNIDSYEYWDGSAWGNEPDVASTIVNGPIGELSVRWNSHYRRWLMMYLIDDEGVIVLRTAPDLTGPWDDARVVVRAGDYPALYAPFMFPKWNDGPDVYFNMSLFGPYNVFLMKTSIPDAEPE